LNAVWPSAKIAVGQMMEVLSDTLGWDCSLLRRDRLADAGHRCETK
jgi:hypothetical protein